MLKRERIAWFLLVGSFLTFLGVCAAFREEIRAYVTGRGRTHLLDQARALDKSGNTGQVAELYKKLVEQYPDRSEVLLPYAQYLDAHGSYDEAAKFYARAASASGGDFVSVRRYGWFLVRMNRSDEAVKLYEEYLGKHPNDACAKLDLGIHYLARNDLENSIKLLTPASQDPLYAFDALSNLAAAYVRLGQPREAIDCWTRVVSMDDGPEKQVFWQDIASSYEKSGGIEKAKEAWGRFLDYFPDSLPAARHLAELCRTSGDNAALGPLELRLKALSPPIVINKSLTRELNVAGISEQDAFDDGLAIEVCFSILKNIPRDRTIDVQLILVREGTSGRSVEREATVEPSRIGPGPFWRGDSLRQRFAFSVPRDIPPGAYRIEMTAAPDGASRVPLGTFSVPTAASTAASPEAVTVTGKGDPTQ